MVEERQLVWIRKSQRNMSKLLSARQGRCSCFFHSCCRGTLGPVKGGRPLTFARQKTFCYTGINISPFPIRFNLPLPCRSMVFTIFMLLVPEQYITFLSMLCMFHPRWWHTCSIILCYLTFPAASGCFLVKILECIVRSFLVLVLVVPASSLFQLIMHGVYLITGREQVLQALIGLRPFS